MFNLNTLVRTNILELEPYSSARDDFPGNKGVFLDANENPFGTLNRYPDPYQKELKEKLSEIKKIKKDAIFIGNGSDEIIDLTFRVFCKPTIDKVLTFTPTYGMYDIYANINNIELIKIPLNKDFQIDISTVKKYLKTKNLKIIFICSPNNPTGNIIKQNDIKFILKKFNGIVFIDEAYIDFSTSKSWSNLIEKYPNLIVSQTFSKAYGLAAARVGIAYTNSAIVSLFNKVKPPYNVSALNQNAALNVLSKTSEYNKQITILNKEKILLKKQLLKLKNVVKIFPSDSNFLLVKVSNAEKIYNYLVAKKIIVRNRNKMINNCIRITIGTVNENRKLIKELEKLEK